MGKEKRFEKVYSQGSDFNKYVEIFVDTQTGVNYLWCKSGYGAGLTVLLDKDGKPVITSIEEPNGETK